MKKLISIILFTAIFISCKAQVLPPQEQIISLRLDLVPRVENAYYKDTENDFQPLLETWKYTSGNEVFKIILKKKAHDFTSLDLPTPVTFYEDVLYGEYKYVDGNGTVLINSLGDINNPNMEAYEHLIWGNNVEEEEAVSGFVPVETMFNDPQRNYLPYEFRLTPISPVTISGQQVKRIKITLELKGLYILPQSQSPGSRVPLGEYIMLEVP